MGLLGSALGRGLAGAGSGLSEIANKYIDNQMLIDRAQAIADINRTSAVQQTKEIDTYTNAPERRAGMRTAAAADEEAIGTMRNKVGLAGRVAEATNAELLAADVNRADKITRTQAKATGETQTEIEKQRGNDSLYLKALRNETAAKETVASRAAADASSAHAELLRLQTGLARKTDELQDNIRTAVVTGDKGAEEQYRAELAVIQGKPGQRETAAHAIAEAQKAMAPALKIIGDTMSSPQAIEEARQTVAEQRQVIKHYAEKAGIDLNAGPGKFEQPTPDTIKHMQGLMNNPAAVAEFKKRFGDEAFKALGAPKAVAPAAPVAAAAEQPPAWLNDEGKAKWLRDKPARDQAEADARKKDREGQGRSLADMARRGITISQGD